MTIQYSLPRWEELPTFDLYIDQMIDLVQQIIEPINWNHQMHLTKAMVNNYTKKKLLPAPIGKKYNMHHVARLIVMTILKPVFSLNDIDEQVTSLVNHLDSREVYNQFCDIFDEQLQGVSQGMISLRGSTTEESVMRSAITAILSKMMCEALMYHGGV